MKKIANSIQLPAASTENYLVYPIRDKISTRGYKKKLKMVYNLCSL
jgi:hypothetical protein